MKNHLLALSIFSVLSYIVDAVPVEKDDQVIMRPHHLRLLATSEDSAEWADPEEWMDKEIKFIDITDHLDLEDRAPETRSRVSKFPIPKTVSHVEFVKAINAKISTDRMRERLTKFTSFLNRYYKSETGVQSQEWLMNMIETIAQDNSANVKITTVNHSWSQKSIIARFAGKVDGDDAPFVIVGSHQDTVRGSFFGDGRAPGADDNGSGSITALEAFTLLCESGFAPYYPVEFHFYSAEEAGLLGSQDVAADYQKEGKNVIGMMQMDMTGYGKNHVYGIVTDYVDKELTEFLKKMALTYGELEVKNTRCNYGCSDHASWNRAGYRSAFPFEGEFRDSSPYIHKKDDTVDHIDFDHMKEFVKLAVGFAVELSSESQQ